MGMMTPLTATGIRRMSFCGGIVRRTFCAGVARKPSNNRKKVLVTTPIFYVNGNPHIGHAYSGVIADGLARYRRLKGEEVIFSTGTDEHGSKVEKAAISNGFDAAHVLDYCTSVSSRFEMLFEKLNTSHNVFVRTTDPKHQETAQNLWKRLYASGVITSGRHSGWYCQSDEAFLTDLQVKDGLSIESGHPVEWIEESNYVFDLTKFQTMLTAWVQSGHVYPKERENEIASFLKTGLRSISVSRPRERVRWAIQVPGDDTQSIYVWLDALANYLTVTGVYIDPDPSQPISLTVDEMHHIVGKDIIRFHALFWPAFLHAAGLDIPTRVFAHGHWTVKETKMSKSLGNVICPFKLLEQYETDAVRYTLLRCGGLANDADFSPCLVESKRDEELANTFGNLLSRCVGKAISPNPTWPGRHTNYEKRLEVLSDLVETLPEKVDNCFLNLEFSKGIILIFDCLREANRVFTATEPWTKRKILKTNPNDIETCTELDTTLYWILETLRVCSILLQPVIPDSSKRSLDILGIPETERSINDAKRFTSIGEERTLSRDQGAVLFKKA